MFRVLRDNALQQISIVEALVEAHDDLASRQPGDRERMVKQYAVASCATRLYAIYERFVESLIADYLDALPEIVAYASLPAVVRNEYRIGISHILAKVGAGRYDHLSHEDVIRWYHNALTNEQTYRFVSEAFTRHDQNLRLPMVETLASRIDLRDLRSWLAQCPEVHRLYDEHTSVVMQLEAELKDFVQVRNDAAHGLLETLQGRTILERYCTIIRALISALASFFNKSLLSRRTDAGRLRMIGTVSEVFERSGAFVAQLEDGCEVVIGMSLHFLSRGFCEQLEIQSLQLDDVPVERVTASCSGFEVGIKCSINPKRNAAIFVGP